MKEIKVDDEVYDFLVGEADGTDNIGAWLSGYFRGLFEVKIVTTREVREQITATKQVMKDPYYPQWRLKRLCTECLEPPGKKCIGRGGKELRRPHINRGH